MPVPISKELFLRLDRGELSDTNLSNSDTPPSELLSLILYGPPFCWLVSGYRGAGKTSLIRHLKAALKEKGDDKTVFIPVDFSRYKDKSNLFRWLIRELYLSLQDQPIDGPLSAKLKRKKNESIIQILETLYEKTFHESVQSTTHAVEQNSSTVLTIDVVKFVGYVFAGWASILGLNYVFDIINWPSATFMCSVLSALAFAIKKSVGYTQKEETKQSEKEDHTRKTLFDDEIADTHFLRLIKAFQKAGFSLVFVFDEMDKIEDSRLDALSAEIKPYMLSGFASFIVVSGQKLFYKYRQANTEDDAVLSSLFSKCIHMALLSREGFYTLFKTIVPAKEVDGGSTATIPSGLVDYFVFCSKRIPRRFFQLLQENLMWLEDGSSVLNVNLSKSDLHIYTKLLDIVDFIEKEEIAPEPFYQAEKDFLIMQMLLACTALIDRKGGTHSIEDFLMNEEASAKADRIPSAYNFESRMRSLQLKYLDSLLQKIIAESIFPAKEPITAEVPESQAISFVPISANPPEVGRLLEFKNLVNCVAIDLSMVKSENLGTTPFSEILRMLERDGAFSVPFVEQQVNADNLDRINELIRDPNGIATIVSLLQTHNIEIQPLIHQLLTFYARQKSEIFFSSYGYSISPQPSAFVYDFEMIGSTRYFKRLLFETVIRRGDVLGDRQFYWDKLRKFNILEGRCYLFFIVFTDSSGPALEAARAKFAGWLNDDPEMSSLMPRVAFVPLNMNEIQLLQNSFEAFGKRFLERQWDHTFVNQVPPPNFHERNDDEIAELFEFKKYFFVITLTPGGSQFWRFGLRFLKDKRRPSKKQHRHEDTRIGDINLCAGDATVDAFGIHQWSRPEQLVISSHNLSPIIKGPESIINYGQTPVTIAFDPHDAGKNCTVTVSGPEILTLQQVYNLDTYQYCMLAAWCDDAPFSLHAHIEMRRKPD